MLFDVLRANRPDFESLFFKKVVPIAGELNRTEGGGDLIDNAEDLALIRSTVQVIVHSVSDLLARTMRLLMFSVL
jgi:hypothetical protein